MRKLLISLVLTAAILLPAALAGHKVNAITELTGEKNKDVVVEQDVDDDFYVASDKNLTIKGAIGGDLFGVGGNVKIEKEVNGDLYLVGGKVVVEKAVNGNVFVMGGEVQIKGQVFDSVYVMAGKVTIDGNVIHDVMVMSGEATINGQVIDDVRVFAGQAKITQTVQGDVIVSSGKTTISGDVYGDIVAGSGTVDIKSNYIGGDLTTYKNTKLTMSQDTELIGEKVVKDSKWNSSTPNVKTNDVLGMGSFAFIWGFIWNFIMAFGLILLGAVAYKLAPVKFDQTLKQMNGVGQNAKSMGVGCLVLPLGVLISIFLAISLIGWPLLGVLLALAFIAKIMVTVFAGTKFGIWILKPLKLSHPVVLGMIVGIFLLQLVTAIPIVGGIVEFFVFFIALGAMVRAWYFKRKDAKASMNVTVNFIEKKVKSEKVEKSNTKEVKSAKKKKKAKK